MADAGLARTGRSVVSDALAGPVIDGRRDQVRGVGHRDVVGAIDAARTLTIVGADEDASAGFEAAFRELVRPRLDAPS